MSRFTLYIAVLAISAALGMFAAFALNRPPAPPVATPVGGEGLLAAAEAAAAEATDAPTDAPEIRMPLVGGGNAGLDDWAGSYRLVNFWATWCAPCRREIPLLKALQEERPLDNLQVIGVAFDEAEAVAEYADEIGFNYPVLVGEAGAMAIAQRFNLELMALPFTLVVAPDGALLTAHVGEIDRSEADHLVAILQSLARGELSAEEARSKLAEPVG